LKQKTSNQNSFAWLRW